MSYTVNGLALQMGYTVATLFCVQEGLDFAVSGLNCKSKKIISSFTAPLSCTSSAHIQKAEALRRKSWGAQRHGLQLKDDLILQTQGPTSILGSCL